MIELYAKLIILKKKTFSQVPRIPDTLRSDVHACLIKQEYDDEGNPLSTTNS